MMHLPFNIGTPTFLSFLTLLAMWIFCDVSVAGDPSDGSWLQWRGPTRNGTVEAPSWPSSLSGDSLQRLWRVELGPSYSGPIVTNDRVFVTETVGKKSESVRALDRRSGAEIWKVSWPGALSVPFFAKANGDWIRSTPACDGERLYVAGMRDVLVCLMTDTGEELWRQDLTALPGGTIESFGFVCSPLIDGDGVIVQTGAGIVRLNKLTGEIQWRTEPDGQGMTGGAFSSPVTATLDGQEQLVVQTRQQLQGRDLRSGELLWSKDIPAFRGMNILTPTVIGNRVFTSSYGGASFMIDVQHGPDGWTTVLLWKNKAEGYMSSPVVSDGHIYLHLRNQRVTCLDAETGEEEWRSKPFGKYWSMLLNDEQILALDEKGELILMKATPDEFMLIDRRTISSDPTWAHLSIADGNIYIRELNAIAAYEWADRVTSE